MLFLCGFLLVIGALAEEPNDSNHEVKLREELFDKRKINPLIRPVQIFNHTVTVEIALKISHIVQLDLRSRALVINGWFSMRWFDKNLKWDPNKYGGIKDIRASPDLLWKPDISLYNMADTNRMTSAYVQTLVIVNHHGLVVWVPPITMQAHCELDVSAFPYDSHDCILKFGSWTFDGYMLDLRIHKNETDEDHLDFLADEPNEWTVVETRTERNEKYYSCCEEPYPDVTYHIKLKRRAPYYGLVLVLPSIVSMLLTLGMFWLPPNAGEKVTMGGFMMMYLLILLIQLHWMLPVTSQTKVPGIVLFCGVSLAMTALSLFLSVATISVSRTIHHSPLPDCVRHILSGRVCCVLCLPQISSYQESMDPNLLQSDQADREDSVTSDDHIPKQEDWIVAATAIDRILFFISVISFIIILCVSFA